ncbi:regulator of hypoxia-inducible factor 1-like [Wyeomyia smithii]|uniref:regulator of hypoxia-inducible factor 1-like n=1 Tax=Wyeomyia smithii TaxID=174621 RepID=UPI0024680377|nr:regulator of hypoxia-inducible factor 1-like [Wyeomyia smithii]
MDWQCVGRTKGRLKRVAWCSYFCLFLLWVDGVVGFRTLDVKQKLPKLFKYDDFDECRIGNPFFQYCVVRTVIHPDEESEIWRNISLLTANSLNFPRDRLERGLCLSGCVRRVSEAAAPIFKDGNLDHQIELLTGDDAARGNFVSQCVNREIYESHRLQGSSTILHCFSEDDFHRRFSFNEKCFLVLAAALILLVNIATLRDYWGIEGNFNRFLKPFSLRRNIRMLLEVSTSNGNLRYLDGLRAIGMLVILLVHASLPMIRMPLKNPEDLEEQTNHPSFPIWNSNNTHMIQFFFTLGGMVMAVSFLKHIDQEPRFNYRYLRLKILNRLARITPAYAFLIFYQATVFKRTKQTPVAPKFIDYCSEHWWGNLLFINNYVHLDEPCMKFGWYLGADFQLFLVGLTIMALIWKFPGCKRACVTVLVLTSFLLPGFVIYKKKLDATMHFNMRDALTELRDNKFFLQFYTPAQTNVGSYFFGIVAGIMYHLIVQNNQQLKAKFYLSKLLEASFLVFCALNGLLVVIPSVTIEKPSLFLAIYGSALKAMFGICYSTLFCYLGLKSNSIYVALLEHPVLQVLGKLSYSIYIVQYSVIYTLYSNMHVPMMYGAFNMLLTSSAIMTITFLSGIMLHLAVEIPFYTLIKQIIYGKIKISKLINLSDKKK